MFGIAKRDLLHPIQKDGAIPSDSKPHCDFNPRLEDINIEVGNTLRQKASSSSYGIEVPAAKVYEEKPEPELTLKPAMPKSKLREQASSSGYGKVAAKARPKTAKKAKPTFQPDLKSGRLKSAKTLTTSAKSSGYGLKKRQQTCEYTPKPRLRGELAREKLGLNKVPTFKPQLHLSASAKRMSKQTPSRLLQKSARQKRDPKPDSEQNSKGKKPYEGRPAELYKEPSEEHDYRSAAGDGFVLDCVAVGNHGTAIPVYTPTKVKPVPGLGIRLPDGNSPAPGEDFEYDINGRRVPVGTAAADAMESF